MAETPIRHGEATRQNAFSAADRTLQKENVWAKWLNPHLAKNLVDHNASHYLRPVDPRSEIMKWRPHQKHQPDFVYPIGDNFDVF
jgi:hypothetical protein